MKTDRFGLAIRLTLLAAAVSFAPEYGLAQKKDLFGNPIEIVGKFEIVDAKARKYRFLTQGEKRLPEVIRVAPPEGFAFAVVELDLRFERDEERDNADIPIEFVTFEVGSEWVASIGDLERTTALVERSGLLVMGAGDAGTIRYEPVFLVPESAKKGTLRIGDGLQVEVEFAGKPEEKPDPAERLSAKILSAQKTSGIDDSESFYSGDDRQILKTTYRGRADLVTIEFEATARVATEANAFSAPPRDFQIAVGDGRIVPAITSHDTKTTTSGMKLFDEDVYYAYVRSPLQEDGTFETGKASLVFNLPKGVTQGKLLYYGAPIADFVVE